MNASPRIINIWLVLILIGLGIAMIYLPASIADHFEHAEQLGPTWKYLYLASVGSGAVLLVSIIVTLLWKLYQAKLRKEKKKQERQKNPSQLSEAQKKQELLENLESVNDLQSKQQDEEVSKKLNQLSEQIHWKLESQKLEIVVFGTISSGKSSLLNALLGRDAFSSDIAGGTTVQRNEIALPGKNQIVLVDTPGLGEVDGEIRQELASSAALQADLILLVVDGPLRESESNLLELLAKMEKRIIVCLNKEDYYPAEEKEKLLNQLQSQVSRWLTDADIVSVRSKASIRTRMRILSDGEQIEEEVELPISIEPLAKQMQVIVEKDGTDLLLANLLLQSRGLIEQAKQEIELALDRRADQLIEKYMWGAGGTAAISPFPLVDIAAGCAISTKMVLDLATIYRQEIDLDVAINLIGHLGKSLLAILGISVATPVISSMIASLIKTVPGAGTLVGGAMQGIVIALVTRWIGNVFKIYFKNEMQEPEGGLAGLAQREWKKVTNLDYLRKLVTQARHHYVDHK